MFRIGRCHLRFAKVGQEDPVQNRVPATRAERPALPDFAPVPRKTNRHDGWTPARRAAADAAIAAGGNAAAHVLEDDPEEHCGCRTTGGGIAANCYRRSGSRHGRNGRRRRTNDRPLPGQAAIASSATKTSCSASANERALSFSIRLAR